VFDSAEILQATVLVCPKNKELVDSQSLAEQMSTLHVTTLTVYSAVTFPLRNLAPIKNYCDGLKLN
jgi:hypothetical protein